MEILSVARRSMAVACCLGSVGAWAQDAAACIRPAPLEFSIDATQRALDSEPPSAPLHVAGTASRYSGTYCDARQCSTSSCGSGGGLQLSFEPARDNRSSVLGYRLQLLSGSVPAGLRAPLGQLTAGTSALHIDLPFDEVTGLDATFALVAVDHAGNESAPSEPFRVAFDGCTQVLGRTGCAEEMPGVTCSNGMCSAFESDAEAENCSLRAPGSAAGHAPLLLALCFGAGALAALRRRR